VFDYNKEHDHGCTLSSRNINYSQEKLDKLPSFLPEIQTLKLRVSELEKEKDALRESLELVVHANIHNQKLGQATR